MRKLLLLLALSIICNTAVAKVHPADGDTVNYRLVGFKVPEKKNSTGYILEVHEYLIRDDGTVHTKFLFEQRSNEHKIVATVPAFGKSYKWRVKYLEKGKVTDSTRFNNFSVGSIVYTDTNKYRMRILKNELVNKDYFIFVDGTRTLYDMDGNALWYLPNIPKLVDDNSIIRDLEITPFNTITFMTTNQAFEIDYDGNLLWKAPDDGRVSGDTSEHYHHEFTRLKNGNYMIIGAKPTLRVVPEKYILPALELKYIKKDNKTYRSFMSATMIEYKANGDIAWSWLSDNIFTDADLFTPGIEGSGAKVNTHMNAFYFDEQKKTIYTSHRNINRVVKISYPSGKVLASYGEAYNKEIPISGSGMFYGQHSCRISKNGQLYLFNNNSNFNEANKSQAQSSSVVFFNEPYAPADTLSKEWEFSCRLDTLSRGFTQGGGSVSELHNTDILVCMAHGRNFIVSKTKKILWDSLLEQIDNEKNWKLMETGYRSTIQTRQEFDNIILDSLPKSY